MSRCIIYEGCFDPPHVAHFWLLQNAKEDLEADAFVVVSKNEAAAKLSNKPNGSDLTVRLEWCRKAFKDIAVVLPAEHLYTVDIIASFVENPHWSYDRWYYLMGPDKDLMKYKDGYKIREMATPRWYRTYDIRSTQIRNRIREGKLIDGLLAPNLEIADVWNHFTR